jgi:Ser/Thr protein kinase RdoA (MazF antagonist)
MPTTTSIKSSPHDGVGAGPFLASGRRREPGPLQILLACGWLSRADAADPRLRIDSLTRSHRLVRVTAPDGRAVVVKQPMARATGGRDLSRELFVYRLAGWIPALAAALPATRHLDEQRQVLVVESLATGRQWPDETDLTPLPSPGVARQMGRAMAAWHRATANVPMASSLASGILHLPDTLAVATKDRSPSAARFMESIAADGQFTSALTEGAAMYRASCLIHGDIRPENWLVRRQAPPALVVIDWEMSGLGDPAWDFASACAESILHAIRRSDALADAPCGWPVETLPTLRDLVAGYQEVEQAALAGDADWARVTLFAGARLLHVASEWAEYPHNVDDGLVGQVTSQARRLLDARQPAAAALAEWAAP